MKILLLEDDYLQGQWIQSELERVFGTKPHWIKSESQFREEIQAVTKAPPSVAVIDVMVKWADQRRDRLPRPDDAKTPHQAGLRCADLLRKHESTRNTPVVFYTVLEEQEFQGEKFSPGQTYLRKGSSIDPLARQVQEALRSRPA